MKKITLASALAILSFSLVFGGGYSGVAINLTTINYITISSTGNATYFGDLTEGRDYLAATSNA